MENIISTCFAASTVATRTIASYSHVIPMVLALFLSIFVYIKSQKVFLSKTLLFFTITFSIWLFGDWIIWTSERYNLIYALWAPLDYIEIVFYALGLYFALVFVKKSDISLFFKTVLFIITLPGFILTVSKQSVIGFNSYYCEASNNVFLGNYKLVVEGLMLAIILFYVIAPFFKKFSWKEKKADLAVLGSMFLFLTIFGVTEYLASTTGDYEMNLYSLFLLPVFLIAIIYSVFELDIFNFHILGTHYLVVGLVVLMGGQLFLITDSTNRWLTILTIVLLAGLSVILFRNLKRESDQRVQIAKLNLDLQKSIKARESLTHLVTHKVKGYFTRTKCVFAEMVAGSFGILPPKAKEMAAGGLASDNEGIAVVDMILNQASLQAGTIKYDLQPFDFKKVVEEIIEEKTGPAETKGLKMATDIKDGNYTITGDQRWLKEAILNLVDNAVKYTDKGQITVGLELKGLSPNAYSA